MKPLNISISCEFDLTVPLKMMCLVYANNCEPLSLGHKVFAPPRFLPLVPSQAPLAWRASWITCCCCCLLLRQPSLKDKMGSKMLQRKYLSSSREISVKRVSKVQDTLGSHDCKADCLLIITGVDSRFNIGCRNALEAVLPGITQFNSQSTKLSENYPEDSLDDLVICIKKGSIHVYCNPDSYHLMMSYAASWDNLFIYCLDEYQYENHEDLSEELKMKSFVEMMNGCQVVAVPYNYGIAKEYQSIPFDAMLVEKWPLIQAFALEDIGGGGFFTMVHNVVDGTELLNDAFSSLDHLNLEILITKDLPQFEKQWNSLVDNVTMSCDSSAGNLESATVSEPLTTFFRHAPIGIISKNSREPSARFGVNTSTYCSDKTGGEKHFLRNSGINGSTAYHMVCNGRDSRGILACTRTYFFEGSLGNTEDGETMENEENLSVKDIRLLANCYLLTVKAFDLAVDEFKKNCQLPKCQNVIRKYITEEAKERDLPFIPDYSNISISWHSLDIYGRTCSQMNGSFHNIEISINNIPSFQFVRQSLGSVCFADTFLTSTIQLKEDSSDTESLVLTEPVKRFVSWQVSKSVPLFTNMDNIKNQETLFGNRLIGSSSAILIAGSWPSFYTDEVVFYGFEKELVLHHSQSGYLSIPCNDICDWFMFDNDSTNSITMLFITPNQRLLSSLPFWLSKDGIIMLAFLPRSKAHSEFYDRAFHFWKDLEVNSLRICTELPVDQRAIYDRVERRYRFSEEKEAQLSRRFNDFPNLEKFFYHFQLSSYNHEPLKEDEMRAILSENSTSQDEQIVSDDSELMLTILTGLPESGSQPLCKSLVSLARDSSRWLAITVPCDIKVPFSAEAFQEQLSLAYKTVTQQKGRPQASSRKRRRLIIQTQGFVDIRDVIYAIEEHPDMLLRTRLKIGSVACCINPNNIYLFGKMQMPFVLEQCCLGFVNCVIFTSCLEPEKANVLANCQKILRYCNPEASFLTARGGEISRTPDVELILSDSSFMHYKALRARKIYNRNRYRPLPKLLSQVTIPFKKPLDKSRFLSNLQHMKGKLKYDDEFKGVVLYMEGKTSFADHADAYDFKWGKLLGMTSLKVASSQLSPRPPSSKKENSLEDQKGKKFFVTFFGIELEHEELKRMMTSWIQQKKVPLDRNAVSKEKLSEIASQHKFDALPPGWFYSGTHFVSMEGDKQVNHPLFETYVDEYIARFNEEIDSYNAAVNCNDLFAS